MRCGYRLRAGWWIGCWRIGIALRTGARSAFTGITGLWASDGLGKTRGPRFARPVLGCGSWVMGGVFRLATVFLIVAICPRITIADSVDACDVFRNAARFDGKTFQVRGVYIPLFHNDFLQGYPKCEGAEEAVSVVKPTGDVVVAWAKARRATRGYRSGRWLLCDLTGVFTINSNGGYPFEARLLTALRWVVPYK